MTPTKVEEALASLSALIEKKRRQADMADHPKANEYGRGAASAMRVVADEMDSEMATLTAALAESERDAARYRWLRDSSIGQFRHPIVVSQTKGEMGMLYVGPMIGFALDAAIDAAIIAKEP